MRYESRELPITRRHGRATLFRLFLLVGVSTTLSAQIDRAWDEPDRDSKKYHDGFVKTVMRNQRGPALQPIVDLPKDLLTMEDTEPPTHAGLKAPSPHVTGAAPQPPTNVE